MREHLSLEKRLEISNARKKYLRENPDKHPWKSHEKFKSKPCEKFKQYLKDHMLNFLEEIEPIKDRYFSVDVMFPDKKIIVEINGNQHYDSDGKLKQYYQERHDLLVNAGWQVYEIHYSLVYNTEFINKFISDLKSNNNLEYVDYSSYSFRIKPKLKDAFCFNCKRKLRNKHAKRCQFCYLNSRVGMEGHKKFTITKEDLEHLIKTHTLTKIGKMFGVSDNAIKKRAIKLGINLNLSPFHKPR